MVLLEYSFKHIKMLLNDYFCHENSAKTRRDTFIQLTSECTGKNHGQIFR